MTSYFCILFGRWKGATWNSEFIMLQNFFFKFSYLIKNYSIKKRLQYTSFRVSIYKFFCKQENKVRHLVVKIRFTSQKKTYCVLLELQLVLESRMAFQQAIHCLLSTSSQRIRRLLTKQPVLLLMKASANGIQNEIMR